MTTAKKFAVAFCVLALAVGGLWYYWEYPVPLDRLIPEEQWVRMEMEQSLSHSNMVFEDPPMEDVLALFPAIRVTRAQNSDYVEDDSFHITLFKGEAWPTMMYVSPSGGIKIAADMDFDNWKCYEGGEALYQYLDMCSKTLTALLPAEKTNS